MSNDGERSRCELLGTHSQSTASSNSAAASITLVGEPVAPTLPSTSKGPASESSDAVAAVTKAPKQRRARRQTTIHHRAARLVQIVNNKPREYANHTYHDLSDVPPDPDDSITCESDLPKDIEKMTFNQKVYHILMQPEYQRCMVWLPHGRAFRVDIPVAFERDVCPKYFGHKRYSSFLRQLNNHGYRHITQGPDRNAFYHECLLRGRPHLLKYMPESKDARRLIPDPANEPDFYSISKLYPLERGAQSTNEKLPFYLVPPALPTTIPNMQTRVASSVDWLQETVPSAKRAHYCIPVHPNSAAGALSHALLTGQTPGINTVPVDLPLPQSVLPGNNTMNQMNPDFLLSALIQQLASQSSTPLNLPTNLITAGMPVTTHTSQPMSPSLLADSTKQPHRN